MYLKSGRLERLMNNTLFNMPRRNVLVNIPRLSPLSTLLGCPPPLPDKYRLRNCHKIDLSADNGRAYQRVVSRAVQFVGGHRSYSSAPSPGLVLWAPRSTRRVMYGRPRRDCLPRPGKSEVYVGPRSATVFPRNLLIEGKYGKKFVVFKNKKRERF